MRRIEASLGRVACLGKQAMVRDMGQELLESTLDQELWYPLFVSSELQEPPERP